MNERQRRFCDEYMANGGNAYQAALSAGYKESTALDAHKWVKTNNPKKPDARYNPEMAAYIAENSAAIEEHNEKIAQAEEIQEFTSNVLRGLIGETVVASNGKKVEVPASIKDRLRSADMLARMKGMYNDKLNLAGSAPVVLLGYDEVKD